MRTSRTSRAAGVVTPASANSLFGRRRGSRSAPRNRSQEDEQLGGIGGVKDGGPAPEEIVDIRSGTTEIPAVSDLAEEAKMLKVEEARRSYLNSCLKQVGTCEDDGGVEEFIKELMEILPDNVFALEPLIPSLRSRFRGQSKVKYASAIQAPAYRQARQQKQWQRSWEEFRKGCMGLSKESEDTTRQNVLGFGFVHGIIDNAVNSNETLEEAVLRWMQVVQKAEYVLDNATFQLVEQLGNDLFKARMRKDYREWFNDNRKSMWIDSRVSLMQLATEAKAYEGSDVHVEKGRQLGQLYKKGGNMAMVLAVDSHSGNNGKSYAKCHLCDGQGHLLYKCPLLPGLRKLAKQAMSGGGDTDVTQVLSVQVQDELSGIRNDLAHLATSTAVDYVGFTRGTQRAMGY